MISFYAGLRAKEIAALTLGNVFDDAGTVREQFILGTEQSKGGQRRTVYLNQRLRKALAEYGSSKQLKNLDLPLFASQKGGHFSANTMCQLFLEYLQTLWVQGCVKPFGTQDLHHAFGQQRGRGEIAGGISGSQSYLDHPEIYRR